MNKRRIVIFIMILSIFLSSCSLNKGNLETDNNEEVVKYELEPDYGGKVILPLTNFKTLNPMFVENSYYYHFSKLIYEPLFEFNNQLEPTPVLVEDYNIIENGMGVKIKLKDNILWHDNTMLSTEDIGFTIDLIKNIGLEGTYGKIFNESLGVYGNFNIDSFLNYRIIDNLNIEIVFDKSYSNKLGILTFPIIPSHIYQADSYEGKIEQAKRIENFTPIGTGPYKFKKYDKFKQLSLESFDNYWQGKPYIDEVIGKVLDDKDLVQVGFETGQINMYSAEDISWHKYKDSPDVYTYEYTSNDFEFLAFNFDNPLFQDEKGVKLRKAMMYGIDRMDIIKRVYIGHAVQIDVPTFPESYLESIYSNTYGYNKERALEILKDLGYTDYNEDGYLINENNETISFKILTNTSNVLRQRTSEIIVEYLIDLGIDAKLEESPEPVGASEEEVAYNEWVYIKDRIESGNFDVVLTGWKLSPIIEYTPLFHTNGILRKTNIGKFSSAKLDSILEDNYVAKDIEDRTSKHEIFEEYFVDVLPYIGIIFKNNTLLVDKEIKGNLEPKFFNLYSGLEKAYINVKTK